MTESVRVATRENANSYEIRIGGGLLASVGEWAASVRAGRIGRVAIISNQKVYGLYGDVVSDALASTGFQPTVHLIGDGERFKNLRTVEKVLQFLGESRLSRTDVVVALGGGVVGDLAGFAASIYLRGIDFLQVPTTLLSMIDSSVGGKTGVNTSFGKNLIGSFYQPRGVLVDTDTLRTLPDREITAGLCEAVKQGAIGGGKLFKSTARFLDGLPGNSVSKRLGDAKFAVELASVLAAQVAFKARIVAGDERESVDKTGANSRKVLNFGHTFGHALEKVTNYRYLRHGEAVGHGIRFASELSKNLGLLAADEVKLLNDVVRRAGKLPPIAHIDPREVFATFTFDKKMINDSLHWILLEQIGKPVIFPHSKIPKSAFAAAFAETARG
ncbi:MAG: 3-dehydroquinate synthase [Pyrinomonadaceae bacterium]